MANLSALVAGPLRRIALLLLVVYLGICVLAWLFQRRLLFLPTRSAPEMPRAEAAAGLTNVVLQASDGVRIESWYWPVGGAKGTVVLFHGNAGHRGDRLFWMKRIRALGWNAFVPDYRGYGGSEGAPSEAGLYRDGDAAFAYARAHTTGPVVLAGSSVGTGVAVEMAVRHDVAGLILTAAPTSMPRVARDAYPFLPAAWLMRDRFDNAAKIGRIACPLLMLHGDADRIIAVRHGRALFERAAEPKRMVILPGRGHNDIWFAEGDAYWAAIAAFLDAR